MTQRQKHLRNACVHVIKQVSRLKRGGFGETSLHQAMDEMDTALHYTKAETPEAKRLATLLHFARDYCMELEDGSTCTPVSTGLILLDRLEKEV